MNLIDVKRPSSRTIVTVATTAVVSLLAIAGLTMVRQPAPAAAPDVHTVELRIDGDGVGQLARVWDDRGQRDVDTYGVTLQVIAPRAVLYTVQAGAFQSASCVILLDGTEVARELADPLTVATCAYVAG
jgi:hypothetical protein